MKEALTFDDLQIIPKYSDVISRKDCDLSSKVTSKIKLRIPVVSSPMDSVTEWGMMAELNKLGGLGILHRFMDIPEMMSNIGKCEFDPVVIAIGVKEYQERVAHAYSYGVKTFLIDVAHGHHKLVENTIKSLKDKYSDIEIIAGNIATSEAAYDLIMWGADSLRVGIGSGCFTPYMKVKISSNKYKNIKDINIGDYVYTHDASLRKVINKFEYYIEEDIIQINDIECTKNHEFYVINKSDLDNIETDDDIDKYAMWIEADELNENYLLVGLCE